MCPFAACYHKGKRHTERDIAYRIIPTWNSDSLSGVGKGLAGGFVALQEGTDEANASVGSSASELDPLAGEPGWMIAELEPDYVTIE